MELVRWICVLTITFGIFPFNSVWSADPSPDHLKASETLIDTLDLNGSAVNFILLLSPESEHSFIRYMLAQETGLGDAMRKDASIIYAETFTQNELEQLTAFSKSEVGEKWIDSQEELARRMLLTFQNNESYARRISVVGCVIGALVPQIEAYKQRAGITTEGISPELLAPIDPVIQGMKITCTCIMDESAEKWGLQNLKLRQNSPEYGAFVNQLFATGKCPVPGQ
jgi:hypothetical protein